MGHGSGELFRLIERYYPEGSFTAKGGRQALE